MSMRGNDIVPGRVETAPPAGSAAQVGAQSGEARDLANTQQSTIDDLRTALSQGDISKAEYDRAVGELFNARLSQLQGDLIEQGRPEAASSVPLGLGTTNQAPATTPGVFGPPPAGVSFDQGVSGPPGKLDEDMAALAGPTSRPNEPVTTGVNRNAIPKELFEALPALIEAANQPNASPAVKALLRLLDYYING